MEKDNLREKEDLVNILDNSIAALECSDIEEIKVMGLNLEKYKPAYRPYSDSIKGAIADILYVFDPNADIKDINI